MSNRYKGGIISATPPTTTGGESGTASGAWTLEQQMQAQAAGLWPLQPTGPYIEDVFSTWLYTGNGSTQTINNGIDLAGKGGLVWSKSRSARNNVLIDTQRGVGNCLFSNLTNANDFDATTITSFNSNGYSIGSSAFKINTSGENFASWTFREQPKFFDVVTYTGTGSAQTISHNLGSAPGCIFVKQTSDSEDWFVYHRSTGSGSVLVLNGTFAAESGTLLWNNTDPTSTQFSVRGSASKSGQTYVAYLFAHNAGGFGLSGTDNVISCGSFTGAATVTLGYEPQWVLYKRSDDASDWVLTDNMRGMYASFAGANGPVLEPNTSDAEAAGSRAPFVNATGFYFDGVNNGPGSSGTYIYIAIRRGPMRTPTTGTSVFSPVTQTAAGTVTTGFPVDLAISGSRTITGSKLSLDRLRGSSTNSYASLFTNSNGVEGTGTGSGFGFDNNTGYVDAFWSTSSMAYWNFRRAPGFFDEICFTVSGSVPLAHNLGVTPELVIYKTRNAADSWWTCANLNGVGQINNTGAWALTGLGNGLTAVAQATSTTISNLNGVLLSSGNTVVAYLFASAPGVSKVGSYTGTGTTQTINCGFTGGARFVLIKRTDSTGDWYVWDTARGMIPANDPYLLLNSTAAEVTGTDFVDTAATGFEITSTAPAAINANGGTFIFLAIA